MKKGQPMPLVSRHKLSKRNLTANPGYQAIHAWVRKWGGTASYCEMEDETCSGKFEWSNISHEYKRDINDYQQLCSSHHSRFDKAYNRKLRRELRAHMATARIQAGLSYAERLKVGAVLVKGGRIISEGRNGTPTGMDNTCEVNNVTKPEVCHAELNVIAFAAKNGTSTNGCTLVITHSPCFECSKLLVQAGVRCVYYSEEYRDTNPLEFLKKAGVSVSSMAEVEELA